MNLFLVEFRNHNESIDGRWRLDRTYRCLEEAMSRAASEAATCTALEHRVSKIVEAKVLATLQPLGDYA